ncbi:MAG: toxin-antitoxin system YwqK family antitoxin [Candidatus Omnitrophota bacterium]
MVRRKRLQLRKNLRISLIFIGCTVVFITLLTVFRTQIISALGRGLMIDPQFLYNALFYVLFIVGVLFFVLFLWMDREDIRFKIRQKQYRSGWYGRDYYNDIKTLNVDQAMGAQVESGKSRRLDVDDSIRQDDAMSLDQGAVSPAGKATRLNYKNGRLDGDFATHFADGKLQAEISYRDGVLDGEFRLFYPSGLLHQEKTFHKGKLNGVYRAWDPDGALFFEIEYQDSVKNGFDRSYRKNGTMEYEDTYVHGRKVLSRTFDESGKLKYEQEYED